MKKLLPAFLIAFVSGFMFFIFEPISMYATNVDDFWFDLYIMIKPSLKYFLLFSLGLSAMYSAVYYINKRFSEKIHVYKGLVLLSFIVFAIMYIHGNFFANNLPPLDGTSIQWSMYTKSSIISCIIMLIITFLVIFSVYKFKYDKCIKVFTFITCAILIMLGSSLISVVCKEDTLKEKERIIAVTNKNLNTISTDKNFVIFLVDAVDSTMFEQRMMDSDYSDMFEDFTYYPDTLSAYIFTRDSIPFIFSGIWNKNELSFDEYANNAYSNSKLIERLKEEQYDINIYDFELNWNNDKSSSVSNVEVLNRSMKDKEYLKQIAKYDLFKYMPWPLKRYSHIETMEFANCQETFDVERFSWDDKEYFDNIKNSKLEKTDGKYFSFVHLEGAHVPFNYDEDLNQIENGTYAQKVDATIKVIDKYINRLKENGVYDNTAIIVMADHGYDYESGHGRTNPILFVKGIDEHHDMIKSDKPISFVDLIDAYDDLLDGKTSEEIFSDIDYERTRKLIWYEFTKENHMVEYETDGKADEWEALKPTGAEYDR